MEYHDYAMQEFRVAGWIDEDGNYTDEMQQDICEHVLRLLHEFSEEGHSGTSANYAVSLFRQLACFEPISPLTGEDHEWTEVREGCFQNKRCSHVFQDETGAYDSEGRIFREPNGTCYQSRGSRVPVTFPYTPKREYVDVPGEDPEGEDPEGEVTEVTDERDTVEFFWNAVKATAALEAQQTASGGLKDSDVVLYHSGPGVTATVTVGQMDKHMRKFREMRRRLREMK